MTSPSDSDLAVHAVRYNSPENRGLRVKRVLLLGFLCLLVHFTAAAQKEPCSTPGTDNSFLGVRTIRLWPGEAPEAKGTNCEDIPTLTIFDPAAGTCERFGGGCGAGRRLCPSGSQSRRQAGGRLVHGARISRIHPAIPAEFERVHPADPSARCPPRSADGAGAGGGLPYRSQPNRDHRLFGGRSPGGAGVNPVRRGQAGCGRSH